MPYIIVSSMLYAGGFIWILKLNLDALDKGFGLFVHGVLTPTVLFVLSIFLIPLTGGLCEDYSQGERVGYFTKISKKGIFWKTWEIKIQVGTGEMAALQSPHSFSTLDDRLAREILKNLGGKARVHYSGWLVMPFCKGSSGYTITKIDWLDGKEE